MTTRYKFLAILGALGLVISGYLLFKSSDPSSVACSIGGGCEKVLTSKYASIFGVPVAALGVLWYVVFLYLLWAYRPNDKLALRNIRLWVVAGLVFSLYLLALEAFVINSYCTWCLASLAVVSIIFVTLMSRKEIKRK